MGVGGFQMIKIFNHYFYKRTLLQISLDISLVMAAVMMSVLLQAPEASPEVNRGFALAFLLALGMLAVNAGLGFYQRVHNRSLGQSRARAVLSLLLTLLIAHGIFFLVPLSQGNRLVLVAASVIGVGVTLAHRVYATHSKSQSGMRQRVLVYGSGSKAESVGRILKLADPNMTLVGYYASPKEDRAEELAPWIVSPGKTLSDFIHEKRVDEIVVALTERRGGSMPMRELLDCKLKGVHVVDIATYFEATLGQIRLDAVSAGWLIFGDGFKQGWLRTAVKRFFDIVCASFLIMLTAPIMLVAALLIWLESGGGPVLYWQERVGLHGRLFKVVKFRSMFTDAEKDGKPRWAQAGDSRITRVGRVIRKLRIDELPQLFSVLIGHMSLVGPRPERPYFVEKLTQEIPYYAVRQSVKPGVTGWAQVRYQYGASIKDSAEKLQYDLYYVKNHSLFLDLVVLIETVGVVLTGKGAQ
jgi:sugar transferase (PEP-CTERM system associated)